MTKSAVPFCTQPGGLHRLKQIAPEPSGVPSRPYRYRCVVCQHKFKIHTGIIVGDERTAPPVKA